MKWALLIALLAPPSIDDLLKAFATMPGLEARFVESKQMALLAAPLESTGRLFFMPPGHLARVVETPNPARVVITPEKLHLTDARGTQAIDLGGRPDVKLFVESFVRVLAGDRAALERIYTLKLVPGDPWTLTLTPRGPPLSKLVRSMEIVGRGPAVERITVHETSGDVATTRILEANPARTFSADEKSKIFGAR